MGFGDSLMASGQAKLANIQTGKKVIFGDGKRRFFDEVIFKDNPRLAVEGQDGVWVHNYPGFRPYIKAEKNGRMIFMDSFRPEVGELFGLKTSDVAKGKILVETRTKKEFTHTVNKAFPYWDEVLKTDLPFIKVEDIQTEDFRDALEILKGAALFVGTDGALHHAAAALNVPAVVIWGGYSSPRHLGYESQVNIHDGSEPCGTYSKVCPHCLKKAKQIDVDLVIKTIQSEYARLLRS